MTQYKYGRTIYTSEQMDQKIEAFKADAHKWFLEHIAEHGSERIYDELHEVEKPDAQYKDCSGGMGWLGDFETEEEINDRLLKWKNACVYRGEEAERQAKLDSILTFTATKDGITQTRGMTLPEGLEFDHNAGWPGPFDCAKNRELREEYSARIIRKTETETC
jgi:hypothetical protein